MQRGETGVLIVRATWPSGAPYLGEAATLSATINGGAANDTEPTELGGGRYQFNLTATETDVDEILPAVVCSVTGIKLEYQKQIQVTDKTGLSLSATGADLITKSSTFAKAVADAVLIRDAAEVEDEASEHSLCFVILASSEGSRTATTWTVKKTDGTTFATKTLTEDEALNPVATVT